MTVLVGLSLVVGSRPASACTCFTPGPYEAIAQAEAIFVGSLVDSVGFPDPDTGSALFRFDVERWVKGDLGNPVTVTFPSSAAQCGFEAQPGKRVGVILTLEGDIPTAGVCSTMPADPLIAAMDPVSFDGIGPPRFVIRSAGRPALQLLDTAGRTLAGLEGGDQAVMCPGDRFLALTGPSGITVVELASLAQVRFFDTTSLDTVGYRLLECADVGGHSVLISVETIDRAGNPIGSIFDAGRLDAPIVTGRYQNIAPALDGWVAIGGEGVAGTQVVHLQSDGTVRVLHDTGPARDPATWLSQLVSADGRRTAVAENGPEGASRLQVFDLATGAAVAELGGLRSAGVVGWIDGQTIRISEYPPEADEPALARWNLDTGRVIDEPDSPLRFGFLVADGRMVGIEGSTLLSVDIDNPSDVEKLRTFASVYPGLVAILDIPTEPVVTTTTTIGAGAPDSPVVTLAAESSEASRARWGPVAAALAVALIVGFAVVRNRRLP